MIQSLQEYVYKVYANIRYSVLQHLWIWVRDIVQVLMDES